MRWRVLFFSGGICRRRCKYLDGKSKEPWFAARPTATQFLFPGGREQLVDVLVFGIGLFEGPVKGVDEEFAEGRFLEVVGMAEGGVEDAGGLAAGRNATEGVPYSREICPGDGFGFLVGDFSYQ